MYVFELTLLSSSWQFIYTLMLTGFFFYCVYFDTKASVLMKT